jgi:hypothetical protein
MKYPKLLNLTPLNQTFLHKSHNFVFLPSTHQGPYHSSNHMAIVILQNQGTETHAHTETITNFKHKYCQFFSLYMLL